MGAVYLVAIPAVMLGIWMARTWGSMDAGLARVLDPVWVVTIAVLALFVGVLTASLIHYSWTAAEAGVLAVILLCHLSLASTPQASSSGKPRARYASGVIGRASASVIVPIMAVDHAWTPYDLSGCVILAVISVALSTATWSQATEEYR